MSRKTTIGQEVEELMRNGSLVPSYIVLEILKNHIKANIEAKGFLIGIETISDLPDDMLN